EAEIAPGALGATPPRPAESVTTLAVTLRLVARSSLPNYAAGEFARLLFRTKAKLVATLPQVGQIEAPDTDKGAALPAHPGAASAGSAWSRVLFGWGPEKPAGSL